MVKKGDYTIENFYQGGYSSLDSNKAYSTQFIGYRIKPSELGAPTKPDTANQIQQVKQLLNQGIIPIEVGALSTEIFSQIPKQHFKEIDRLAKLTGEVILTLTCAATELTLKAIEHNINRHKSPIFMEFGFMCIIL